MQYSWPCRREMGGGGYCEGEILGDGGWRDWGWGE
jgi:hypothetical protein